MRENNIYSKHVKNNTKFNNRKDYLEGVFLTNQGKFVVRVIKGKQKNISTLSQHDTVEKATEIFNEYKKNN